MSQPTPNAGTRPAPAVESQLLAQLSRELNLPGGQVQSVVALLDAGNTIPFLARYRKEQTGGLDEEQLRALAERLAYVRNLAARKDEVARLIAEQNRLTPELQQALSAAETLQRVDDIYRPFRPKRQTRAAMAQARGLAPLAEWLLSRPGNGDLQAYAGRFVQPKKGVESAEAALAGARDIIAEQLADDPDVRAWVRNWTQTRGSLVIEAVDPAARTPYEHYYSYREGVSRMRPHQVLAINRGEREDVLRVKIDVPVDAILAQLQSRLLRTGPRRSPADPELIAAAQDGYARLLAPAVGRDVRAQLTEAAETQAIRIFAANLRALLLTPPIRGKTVLGVDPAYRTGCKLAVVDATGKLLEVAVVYPTPPHNRVQQAEQTLLALIARHAVDVLAIGNGTASRETEAFVAGVIAKSPRPLAYVMVNEAGASVYSASPLARTEFPELDVSERSAASIARRLQDPLAELVKIDPQAIGVGQYQHDVAQKALAQALGGVVESAVNSVGVDLNTASAALLGYVAGVSQVLAANIVAYRDEHGPYADRRALLEVPRLGPKTFEQCAGFLRIPGAANPLDNTPIHPESYPVTKRLLTELGFTVADVGGGATESAAAPAGDKPKRLRQALSTLDKAAWANRLGVGEPTLVDIVEALLRPGRDPRDELPPPVLRTDVVELDDLKPGMILTGTVRNVVDFGAFVDIGVHQDGLVHISELAERRVRHPLDVLSVGDIVRVRVLAVEPERQRIALSLKGVDA
ncbi:MAG TPA: Tex family protein [Limnochordia bacterium]|nr:Tex family protein [Limnochordia bacterium]